MHETNLCHSNIKITTQKFSDLSLFDQTSLRIVHRSFICNTSVPTQWIHCFHFMCRNWNPCPSSHIVGLLFFAKVEKWKYPARDKVSQHVHVSWLVSIFRFSTLCFPKNIDCSHLENVLLTRGHTRAFGHLPCCHRVQIITYNFCCIWTILK